MSKGLMLMADGVEETESIAFHDILTRAGIQLDAVSIKDCHRIHTSMGLTIRVDKNIKEITDIDSYDFIFVPGGKKGVENIKKSRKALEIIKYFHSTDKLLCAICAGPSVYGMLGYLDGKHYTCFPGFQVGKGIYEDVGSVVDNKLITGHSMYYTIEFAEKVVKYYLGDEGINKIIPGTRGVIKK